MILQKWVEDLDKFSRWNLLTALRGPDNKTDEHYKQLYTTFIRCATLHDRNTIVGDRFVYPPPNRPTAEDYNASHYLWHVSEALCVIKTTHPHENIRKFASLLDLHSRGNGTDNLVTEEMCRNINKVFSTPHEVDAEELSDGPST